MPSSFGLWLGAYAEGLVMTWNCWLPLMLWPIKIHWDSGAGYGSSSPLNRTRTTELLQFGALNANSVYAQMSRGKTERVVATGIGAVAATLSRSGDGLLPLYQPEFRVYIIPG